MAAFRFIGYCVVVVDCLESVPERFEDRVVVFVVLRDDELLLLLLAICVLDVFRLELFCVLRLVPFVFEAVVEPLVPEAFFLDEALSGDDCDLARLFFAVLLFDELPDMLLLSALALSLPKLPPNVFV